ncbi:MAG: hypothetical protein ABIR47_06960 [Candidatus Kapaibacterium sp.]
MAISQRPRGCRSLMLLTDVRWACRRWALTILAPSERYHRERGQRHKTLTDWARQAILQLHRWLPDRSLVVVAGQQLRSIGAAVSGPIGSHTMLYHLMG